MLKKLPLEVTRRYTLNVKRYKKCTLFFFHEVQLIYELKHMVRLSKTMRGIFHFRFCLSFIKLCIFDQQKAWTL